MGGFLDEKYVAAGAAQNGSAAEQSLIASSALRTPVKEVRRGQSLSRWHSALGLGLHKAGEAFCLPPQSRSCSLRPDHD